MHAQPNQPATSPRAGGERKPLTAKRLRRKLRRACLFLLLASLIALLVLTRTGVTRSIVLPHLAGALNLEVRARSVVIAPDLTVVMEGVRFRIPGLRAEAGEVLAVERLVASIDWFRLPSPNALREIDLERPRLRVSQSRESGEINVAALALFGRVRGGEIETLPTVVVRNGVLELGEHDPARYDTLASIPFSGVLAPQPGGVPGRSLFSLTKAIGQTGFEMTGLIDQDGASITLGGLTLNDWPVEAIPTRWREVWTRLNPDGRIAPRRIAISPSGGVTIHAEVERIALTIPFGVEQAGEGLRLSEVTGDFQITERSLSADLSGRAGRLTQHVAFDLWGFNTQTSPFAARFTTEPFRLERDLDLLRYVPSLVHEQLARFGQPEADVEATVWLARGARPPDAPAPETGPLAPPDALIIPDPDPQRVRLDGTLRMWNGRAAYRNFPYPFRDMSALFRFDRDSLRIEDLHGVGPTGARLSGSGDIAPLGDTAAVRLQLRVDRIPIDDELITVLNPTRRALVRALFSKDRLDALVQAGLVRPWSEAAPMLERLEALRSEREAWTTGGIAPGEIARLDEERDRIRAELDRVPPFRLAGVADARITVIRHEGEESRWEQDVRFSMDEVGLLSDYFALPAIGRGVTFSIADNRTVFRVASGSTLRGGEVAINAEMPMHDGAPQVPVISVTARAVPIDDLLLHAIAGPERDQTGGLAGILHRLRLEGTLDSTAAIGPEGDSVRYRIETTFDAVRAAVDEPSIILRDLAGAVVVEGRRVELDLAGVLDAGGIAPPVENASLRATIHRPDPDHEGPSAPAPFDARVRLPGADLRVPIERLAAVLDPGAGTRLAELRARFDPAGRLTAETRLSGDLASGGFADAKIAVSVTDLERLAFDAGGLRIQADRSTGAVRLDLDGEPAATFERFEADLSADAVPSGRLRVHDRVPLAPDAPAPWSVALEGGRFESPLTRAAIERSAPAGFVGLVREHDPRGLFDLTLDRRAAGAFAGTIRPRSLVLSGDRGEAVFDDADGSASFEPGAGRLDAIRLRGEGVAVRADGGWTDRGGTPRFAFDLGIDADTLRPELLGLAPRGVGALFDALEVSGEGPIRIPSLRIEAETGADASIASFRIEGHAEVSNGGLRAGVPVTELDGTLTFRVEQTAPGGEPAFALSLESRRWRLLGLRMTGGRAEIRSGREPGSILVPVLHADAHGGRFTGSARVARDGNGDRRFWSDLQLAEVRLAPLLEDVRIRDAGTLAETARQGDGAEHGGGAWDQSEDRSRGLVNASFSIAGGLESASDRRGRGRIVASGGPVVLLPLLTPLIEFSNLRMPLGEELRLALASLYLDGDTVVFEDLAVISESIELLGFGEMSWPGAELDLRVRSQAVDRIPVLSTVVETVRDELLTTRIRGPLADPRITTESFTATRRVMGSLFGGGNNPNRARLREISGNADGIRQRIRQGAELLDRLGAGQVSPTARGGNDPAP
jgi:hypothetical protein